MTGAKWGKYKALCLITSPSQEMRDRKKDSTDKVASEWVKRRKEERKQRREGARKEEREGRRKRRSHREGRQGKPREGKGRRGKKQKPGTLRQDVSGRQLGSKTECPVSRCF